MCRIKQTSKHNKIKNWRGLVARKDCKKFAVCRMIEISHTTVKKTCPSEDYTNTQDISHATRLPETL